LPKIVIASAFYPALLHVAVQFGILHILKMRTRALVGGLLLELTAYALEVPPNQNVLGGFLRNYLRETFSVSPDLLVALTRDGAWPFTPEPHTRLIGVEPS
jgi:hypothetical protein